jgi:hypothetical protein
MSLSQRLKAAEYDRRLAAGLPVDHLAPGPVDDPIEDFTRPAKPILDLTDVLSPADVIPIRATSPVPARPDDRSAPTNRDRPAEAGVATPISSDELTPSSQIGARSRIECENCGGPCQIDLIDAINQTVSLSCLSCYHMFRVDTQRSATSER